MEQLASATPLTQQEALGRIKDKIQRYAGNKITVTLCEPVRMYKAKASEGVWQFLGFTGYFILYIDRVLGGTFIMRCYDPQHHFKLRFEQEVFVGMELQELTPKFLSYQTGNTHLGFAFKTPQSCKKAASKLRTAIAVQISETKSIKIIKKKENFFGKMWGKVKKGWQEITNGPNKGGNSGDIKILRVQNTVTLDPNGSINLDSLPKEWKLWCKKKGIKKRELRDPELAPDIMAEMNRASTTFNVTPVPVQAPPSRKPKPPPGRKKKPPPPPNRGRKPPAPPAKSRQSKRVDKATLIRTFQAMKDSGSVPRVSDTFVHWHVCMCTLVSLFYVMYVWTHWIRLRSNNNFGSTALTRKKFTAQPRLVTWCSSAVLVLF